LAAGLGIAFRNKPADITSVVVIDGPSAQKTLAMLQTLSDKSPSDKSSPGKSSSNKNSTAQATVLDRDAALKAFHFGKFDLAIESNPDGSYTYYYDPARPESVLSRAEIDAQLQSAAGRKDALATSAQSSSEPGSRYIDFLIPGLLGMNLMNSGMWGVGFALVEMRQRKLLKRFVATPMRRSDFLLALTSSRLVLMVIEVGLLLTFGVLVFHMPMQGSVVSVLLLGSLGAVAFGGVGLLTACRAQKIETVSGLINVVMMPMWIFSGVFFSYQRFPAITHPFIKALPLTALNDALRATILEGATLGSQSGRLLVLAVWGGVSFVLALRWFRWT
jgi:ABC-type multidrug transport system permease subunit